MDKQIILGSKSPRRKQLLGDAGLNFKVDAKDVEEIYPSDIPLEEVPTYLAKLKANPFENTLSKDQLLITADTIVILGDKILGKPMDLEEAKEVIHLLSGKLHKVITGICLTNTDKQIIFSELTEVKFYPLTAKTINQYVEKYQPLDKAGSYAIQEWIGLVGIEYIKGSYSNVLGLPIARLLREMEKFGISIL